MGGAGRGQPEKEEGREGRRKVGENGAVCAGGRGKNKMMGKMERGEEGRYRNEGKERDWEVTRRILGDDDTENKEGRERRS